MAMSEHLQYTSAFKPPRQTIFTRKRWWFVLSFIIVAILSIALPVSCAYQHETFARNWITDSTIRTSSSVTKLELVDGRKTGAVCVDASSLLCLTRMAHDSRDNRPQPGNKGEVYYAKLYLSDGKLISCLAMVREDGITMWKSDGNFYNSDVMLDMPLPSDSPSALRSMFQLLSKRASSSIVQF
jgi:hypothetical protein